MNKQSNYWLVWTPRILSIVYILFLAIFALDVFGEYNTLAETLGSLFMHLVPNIILLLALIIAWRWKLIGGVTFLVLGVISMLFFNTYESLPAFLLVSLPNYVIGVLFLLDGLFNQFSTANVQR